MVNSVQLELIDAINTARSPIGAFMLGIAGYADPNSQLAKRAHNIVIPTKASPSLHTDRIGRINSPLAYHLPLKPSMEHIKKNPNKNIEFLTLPIKAAILHVGDAFSRFGYLNKAPELEFLRHIRNAIAHGNRFNIKTELKKAAQFDSYTITKSLNGTKLLADGTEDGFLYAGDALALFDYLEARLSENYYLLPD
jgi:hypothetical protein